MRIHVTPAHPKASIPDPAHPGFDLPPAGLEVERTAYWLRLEARGDVIVGEIGADPHPGPPPPAGEGEEAAAKKVK